MNLFSQTLFQSERDMEYTFQRGIKIDKISHTTVKEGVVLFYSFYLLLIFFGGDRPVPMLTLFIYKRKRKLHL